MKRFLHTQRGQSATEYLVGAVIVLVLLAAATSGEHSLLNEVFGSIRTGWERFLAALSLPQ